MLAEPNVAAVASLIGEPTRATILSALMGGEALPASELAFRAHVTRQTASSHLQKLLDGNLIKVNSVGRHRYYSLKSREVARLLEALALVAPIEPTRERTRKISEELCTARTCYDHLAGKLGVALTRALIEQAYLIEDEERYRLTDKGTFWFEKWEIDVDHLKKSRRKFAYQCLDWSERHFHMAGALGAAVAEHFFEKGWTKRLPHTRALGITPLGERMLFEGLGIRLGEGHSSVPSSS